MNHHDDADDAYGEMGCGIAVGVLAPLTVPSDGNTDHHPFCHEIDCDCDIVVYPENDCGYGNAVILTLSQGQSTRKSR